MKKRGFDYLYVFFGILLIIEAIYLLFARGDYIYSIILGVFGIVAVLKHYFGIERSKNNIDYIAIIFLIAGLSLVFLNNYIFGFILIIGGLLKQSIRR